VDEATSTPISKILPIPFDGGAVAVWATADEKHQNWPIVYTINNDRDIYVGETTSALKRIRQHLEDPRKSDLTHVKVIIDDSYNKSVCLDLESHLIRYFAADGRFRVTNGNHGITDADYFEREKYRKRFDEVFRELTETGLLTRSIPDIVNSDLFKYSPFKAINPEQAIAVEGIVETLFEKFARTSDIPMIVQGDPGTGKTIVAVYLMKLLTDIGHADLDDDLDRDSIFAEFFQPEYQALFANLKFGIVIPQGALRESIRKVFAKTPGLNKAMVMSQFDVGTSEDSFDLLIVDEAHRLGQRANQSSASLNIKFGEINERLFGQDNDSFTQLDWIQAKSKHQLLLIDKAQSVKPGDLPKAITSELVDNADRNEVLFRLSSQMRVEGGNDYIEHVGAVLGGVAAEPKTFGKYDFRIFDDPEAMRREIIKRDQEVGLARMLAGYAWDWTSRKKGFEHIPDIVIGDFAMPWNRKLVDWVSSPTALEEVGSIHTVQGYDLNYAGVIIGRDLQFDTASQTITFSRANYFDKKGAENNPRLGISYSDAEIMEFVKNIYRVLLTRGIKGTYVYICDENLREYIKRFFS
jgi:DUF2075 family protein